MWTVDFAPRMVIALQDADEQILADRELSFEALYHEAFHVEEAASLPFRVDRPWPALFVKRVPASYLG